MIPGLASPHLARLRELGARLRSLRAVPPGSAMRLRDFGPRARRLVARDAARRWTELRTLVGHWRLTQEHTPSILDLSGAILGDEPRFSLLLAALLDSRRSGPLAPLFWRELLRALVERAPMSRRETLLLRVAGFSETILADLVVDPSTYGAEWECLDVFARAVDADGNLKFALVVENKIRVDTDEQPRQLARYHELISGRFDAGAARTVFVFLTEAPRAPKTAEATASEWHPLLWADVERAMAVVGENPELPERWRWVAHGARDAIRREILGKPTIAAIHQRLDVLRVQAGAASTDDAWAALHEQIVAITALTLGTQ